MKKVCTLTKSFLNKSWKNLQLFFLFPRYHNGFPTFRQVLEKRKCGSFCRRTFLLSLAERLAVGTLILSRICLMGTNQNAVQRAVVLTVAMICAGLDGAFDALVCVAVHDFLLLLLDSSLVWLKCAERNMVKSSFSLHFTWWHGMIIKINMKQGDAHYG